MSLIVSLGNVRPVTPSKKRPKFSSINKVAVEIAGKLECK